MTTEQSLELPRGQSRRAFVARAASVALGTALVSLACGRRSGETADTVKADGAAAAAAASLSPATQAGLLAMVQRLFPHPNIAADAYQVSVEALIGAAGQAEPVATMLTTGVAALNDAAGGAFATVPPERQTELLATQEATPFFQTVRATTVFTFYNQPKIWDAFGYEGDAWAKGGYLVRGLADIDWLPTPGAAP